MTLDPQDIAPAYAALVRQLDEIETVHEDEPERLGPLPAVALQWKSVRIVGQDTGGLDLEWSWRVALYVNASGGREAAQAAMFAAMVPLVGVTRDRPKLGLDVLDWAVLEDDGGPVEFNDGEKWAVKTFTLNALGYSPHED